MVDRPPPNGDGVLWSVFATTFRVASRPFRAVAGPSGIDVPRRVEEAAMDAVATPAAQRAIDDILAGPLPEMIGRSLGRHRVVERVVAEVVASDDVNEAVVSALESDRASELLREVLESPALERLLTEAVESRLTAELLDRVLASPQVREALMHQSASFAGEAATAVRARAVRVDAAAERGPRRWLRRAPRPAAAPGATAPVPYAGVATRGVALAADAAITAIVFVVGSALVALVGSLVGELRPQWLAALLLGSAFLALEVVYFAGFWSTVGQTPGMRMLGLRVVGPGNAPPGFGRSLARLGGLLLAIVPCFAGFLPALVDDRRRGLHDFIAGTVVVYGGTAPVAARERSDGAR
jgi:uncharacterized RDD family membrane protein YckC